MAYGNLNVDTITGSGASSVIVNNGSANVAGFTTGNNLQMLQNGGGIVFSNSSATINSTLNDYEIGTWTPTDNSGASLSITVTAATYTKIGRTVTVSAYIQYPSNSNGSNASLSLPFSGITASGNYQAGSLYYVGTSIAYTMGVGIDTGGTTINFRNNTSGGNKLTNANLSSFALIFSITYNASF